MLNGAGEQQRQQQRQRQRRGHCSNHGDPLRSQKVISLLLASNSLR